MTFQGLSMDIVGLGLVPKSCLAIGVVGLIGEVPMLTTLVVVFLVLRAMIL